MIKVFLKKIILYIDCARPSHWIKNIFMLPGFVLALAIEKEFKFDFLSFFFIGFLSTCLLSSANYSLNEVLDRNYDKNHPVKKNRPLAQDKITYRLVLLQYIVLIILGLLLASNLTPMFFIISIFFLFMGLVYNVPPLRAKEIPYLDVLVEAINNPIRLFLGWSSICTIISPPASLTICYWFGGAFLMAMKRYSEYKMINDKIVASRYRKSFKYYNEKSLLLSSFYYALLSIFFLAVFIIKYHIEFIILVPFISHLFVWYLKIAISKKFEDCISTEKLYKKYFFLTYCGFIGIICIFTFFIEIPFLNHLVDHTYLMDKKIEWIDL